MNVKTVGLVVFQRMAAADLTAPAEAFARTKSNQAGDPESFNYCYRVLTLGLSAGACATECGIVIQPQVNLEEAPPIDTLFVSGDSRSHTVRPSKKFAKWLQSRSSRTRRIVGVGTGVYELAATGLLNGRQVAVHWRLANDFALRFPNVRVKPNALFIKDGPFYSCAGGASAIDLSLSLIEEDFGRQIALNVARELVVHLKRTGEQEQYSEALQFQVQSSGRDPCTEGVHVTAQLQSSIQSWFWESTCGVYCRCSHR